MSTPSQKSSSDVPQRRAPARAKGRARVASLIDAAVATFQDKGYEAATMTEIAARAGASIGTLYQFFATKELLAEAILVQNADELSARLDALRKRLPDRSPADIADALFVELAKFLDDHPAYSILLDAPSDESWRRPVRAHRRKQVSALFAHANPKLPADQIERLALIVPQLMRIGLILDAKQRGPILAELRLMLTHHLTAPLHRDGLPEKKRKTDLKKQN
jgi:AcrR family transcriptional regulator